MIDRSVFILRLPICKQCEFWKGACLKGHALKGNFGCPVKKFDGVNGASWLEDLPLPGPHLPQTGGPGCCGGMDGGEIKPLSWMEVWKHMTESMRAWQIAGFPMLSGAPYAARIEICKICPKSQYRWYQCRHCKCIVYTKAKLATEECPHGLWPLPEVC